ncbi:unnamed protein product [Linum tenue]|uniref:Subtilisin-like protease fibronectin type-III domain-containing protein n=1 Tax=Linum tenue TaxID=586396 RepID=A0AAV0HEC1_9ROSI|nr:unnamed protein product [Linum tenue]
MTNVAATTGNDTTAWVYQGSIGLDGGGGVVVKVVPRVLKFVQEGETKAFKVIFQSNRTVGRKTVTGWVKWTNRHFTVRSVFVAEMV